MTEIQDRLKGDEGISEQDLCANPFCPLQSHLGRFLDPILRWRSNVSKTRWLITSNVASKKQREGVVGLRVHTLLITEPAQQNRLTACLIQQFAVNCGPQTAAIAQIPPMPSSLTLDEYVNFTGWRKTCSVSSATYKERWRASEMAQWMKELVIQAWQTEFTL